jgi:hypothetical protein
VKAEKTTRLAVAFRVISFDFNEAPTLNHASQDDLFLHFQSAAGPPINAFRETFPLIASPAAFSTSGYLS